MRQENSGETVLPEGKRAGTEGRWDLTAEATRAFKLHELLLCPASVPPALG